MAASASNSTYRVPSQGGILEGTNPSAYDDKNPMILFIIQASIVIGFTRILHWPLAKINQPPVMAEVVTGILLGPSVMGRIPGFTQRIFPSASMPPFSLAANIGLVLYLFLVGLEVDLRLINRNWRVALSVSMLGMILPFGLGAAIAYGLYHQFRDDSGVVEVEFSIYLLFIGVAMAITAFPVLCRILTSLNLLGTTVGVIVLSAGIGNDVVGWILLALCVTLINSGASLTALWILLVCTGYCIFIAFPIRWALLGLLRRTGSLVNGPTQSVVAITVMLVLASAFFTQIIGVHAIFGAFLIGLICPHGIFAIRLQEKIEDLVSVLLLPLYFALSGLNTNLGLLNSGVVWGYVIGVCAIALVGKIVGGTVAARLNGLVWRESLAIGCLMSCKGLVELIVLNIGFQAHILSQRTFTIFVVMALITTFTTTPLVLWIYPPCYRTKLQLWKDGKLDWNGDNTNHNEEPVRQRNPPTAPDGDIAQRVLLYLRLDSLSSIFTLTSLLARKDYTSSSPERGVSASITKGISQTGTANHEHMTKDITGFPEPRLLDICGLRLMELSERDSSVMKVCESEEFGARDPVIKAFTTFGHSQDTGIAINGQLSVVPVHTFSDEIIAHAQEFGSEFVFLPWSETGTISEYTQPLQTVIPTPSANTQFNDLAGDVFHKASHICNVGVLLNWNISSHNRLPGVINRTASRAQPGESGLQQSDRNTGPDSPSRGKYRIIVPFVGTKDGICAVRLGFQLAKNDFVELEVLDLRSHGEVQLVDANSPVNTEFAALKANIHPSLADRVAFVEDSMSLLPLDEIVITRLQTPATRETIAIVGRNLTSAGSPGDLSAAEANSKNDLGVLGWLATRLLAHVIEEHSSTALLVVQGAGEAEHVDPKDRRKGASAHLAEAITEAGRRLSWAR